MTPRVKVSDYGLLRVTVTPTIETSGVMWDDGG
jgi:hypothetical protein